MNVAFIPIRGGSKSIPLKNIKLICGKPLVYWTLKAACECKYIDKVYVATDSREIKNCVNSIIKCEDIFKKTQIIGRSVETASDTASTESAMLEFAHNYDFDNIVLIQATSPLLKVADLNKGFLTFNDKNTDSVLSVVRQKRFNWEYDEKGFVKPLNYDYLKRPRRQDFDGYLVENGAFYITTKERLLKYKNRLSGKIKAIEMDEDTFFEIDEPGDWEIIESLMKRKGINIPIKIPDIKMFLTDCDGCLTDGGMYYSEHGDELKKFNTRDGMGFAMLKEKGILTGIITNENTNLNQRRADKLKLDILEQACIDKAATIIKLCKEYNVPTEKVVYIGDDLNDVEALKIVGYGCCPANASDEVKMQADYVASSKGGEGVVREIADMILERTE